MQIDRSIQLVFPPAPQGAVRTALGTADGATPHGAPGNVLTKGAAPPETRTDSPSGAPERLRPGSSPRPEPGAGTRTPPTPAQAPSAAPASTTLSLSEQARQLSLAEQLEQGKHQGLFTHLTYSRAGALAPVATQPPLGGSDAFARSAADIMREFSEGLAALQGPPSPEPADEAAAPPPAPSAAAQDLASRLRQGWQQVTARLSARA
ncbi:MAG: hypothetical protein ACT4NV_15660 [Rhodoferax sp.]